MGDDLNTWLTIIRDFGFPGAMLIFFCICIWKGGKWLGTRIIEPMKERHLSFLDAIQKIQDAQAASIAALSVAFTSHDEWERGQIEERNSKTTAVILGVRNLEDRIDKIETESKKGK